MTGAGYVWIILGWYTPGWYLTEDEYNECTRDEIKQAVEGTLYISAETLTVSTSKLPTVSGIVSYIN